MEDSGLRLNKFLAQHLHIGRRAADDLITSGKVTINGERPELGARVFANDAVAANGQTIRGNAPAFLYVLLNKPAGYVCSRRQQGSARTIYTLLPAKFQHLKTVGRLDKDSSGLLLLTNNGDLAHRFTHPSFYKTKVYEVTLSTPLQPLHHQMINDIGVHLQDGPSKLQLEKLANNGLRWRVTMHEGRNRQIRRTFAALGYTVTALHRTQFGPLNIAQLKGERLLQVTEPHV